MFLFMAFGLFAAAAAAGMLDFSSPDQEDVLDETDEETPEGPDLDETGINETPDNTPVSDTGDTDPVEDDPADDPEGPTEEPEDDPLAPVTEPEAPSERLETGDLFEIDRDRIYTEVDKAIIQTVDTYFSSTPATLTGSAGDDLLYALHGHVDTGAGDDQVMLGGGLGYKDVVTLNSGAGDDMIINEDGARYDIDAGEGDDTIIDMEDDFTATLGDGEDLVVFDASGKSWALDGGTITDFDPDEDYLGVILPEGVSPADVSDISLSADERDGDSAVTITLTLSDPEADPVTAEIILEGLSAAEAEAAVVLLSEAPVEEDPEPVQVEPEVVGNSLVFHITEPNSVIDLVNVSKTSEYFGVIDQIIIEVDPNLPGSYHLMRQVDDGMIDNHTSYPTSYATHLVYAPEGVAQPPISWTYDHNGNYVSATEELPEGGHYDWWLAEPYVDLGMISFGAYQFDDWKDDTPEVEPGFDAVNELPVEIVYKLPVCVLPEDAA